MSFLNLELPCEASLSTDSVHLLAVLVLPLSLADLRITFANRTVVDRSDDDADEFPGESLDSAESIPLLASSVASFVSANSRLKLTELSVVLSWRFDDRSPLPWETLSAALSEPSSAVSEFSLSRAFRTLSLTDSSPIWLLWLNSVRTNDINRFIFWRKVWLDDNDVPLERISVSSAECVPVSADLESLLARASLLPTLASNFPALVLCDPLLTVLGRSFPDTVL